MCHYQTVLWTEGDREGEMTLLLCPPNSLSCIDSVSLGRAGVSEKVNLGWPSRLGQSGIRAEILWFKKPPCSEISVGPTSKGGRRDHLCQEFSFLASGLHSWPRRSWLNIMDAFLFCRQKIKTATWCCHHWICGIGAGRVSLLPHRHFLIPLCHI